MKKGNVPNVLRKLFLKRRMEAHLAAELPSGRIIYFNRAFQRITEYSKKDTRELTLWQLIAPREQEKFLENLVGAKEKSPNDNVYTVLKRNRGELKGEFSLTVESVDGKKLLLCWVRDVTEREKIKEQEQQEKRIQAMGTLAAGIAHEFNNILAAIQGYAQLLGMALGENSPFSLYVREIEEGCQRAARLTGKMVLLSRLHDGNRVPLKLNEFLQDLCQQLRESLPESIFLETNLSPLDPVILADPVQMEQLLTNIVNNARDALGDGGTLSFRTSVMELDEVFRNAYPWARPGRYAEVEVVDTGDGIPEDVLPRIFEPFFSTKPPGQGTGLGLSIAYSIVKAHGGYIVAESPVSTGRGTALRVFFPLWEEKEEVPKVKEPPSPKLEEGKEKTLNRILVVDDEPQIRDILERALTQKGYQVTLACDGNEGLAKYGEALEKGRPIDLVILDLAMPVMSGELCLEAILRLDPEARVIVVTGKWPEFQKMETLRRKVKSIIAKPFRLEELMEALRRSLEEVGH